MSSGAKGIQGQVIATMIFDPSVSPPALIASQGFGPAEQVVGGPIIKEDTPKRVFIVSPSDASGGGCFGGLAPPSSTSILSFHANIESASGVTYQDLACEPSGIAPVGLDLKLSVVDAAGALVDAEVNRRIRVTVWRAYTPGLNS